METAEDTLISAVSERLSALRTTPFAVEKSAGLAPDAVRSVLRGGKKSGTTLNRARAICDALGIEFYIGPPRSVGAPFVDGLADGGAQADLGRAEALRAGYLPIPWADQARRADPPPVAFARAWLSDAGLDPERLALAVVTHSRLPGHVAPGDTVLLDRHAPRAGDPRTWLVRDGVTLTAARIVWLPDGSAVLYGSDDLETAPEHRSREAMTGTTLLGQVVWAGGSI